MTASKRINSFLKNRAGEAIINRGKNISQGKVSPVSSSKLKGRTTCIFHIVGTKKYTVVITIHENEKISTSCNCPYCGNTELVCKHSVAALLWLGGHFETLSDIDLSNVKKGSNAANKWHSLGKAGKINRRFINKYSDPANRHFVHKHTATLEERTDNSFRFHVVEDDDGFYFDDDFDDDLDDDFDDINLYYQVDFRRENDELTVHCNCAENKVKVCTHTIVVLELVFVNNPSFFQSNLLDVSREEIENASKDFEIDENQIDQFFEKKQTLTGAFLQLKDQYQNLLLPSEFTDFQLKQPKITQKDLGIESESELQPVIGLQVHHHHGIELICSKYGTALPYKTKTKKLKVPVFEETSWHRLAIKPEGVVLQQVAQNQYSVLERQHPLPIYMDDEDFSFKLLEANRQNLLALLEIGDDLPAIFLSETNDSKGGRYVKFSNDFFQPKVRFHQANNVVSASFGVSFAGDKMFTNFQSLSYTAILADDEIYLLNPTTDLGTIFNLVDLSGIQILDHQFEDFFNSVLSPISNQVEIQLDNMSFKDETTQLKDPKKQLYISEIEGFILIKPAISYENDSTIYNPLELNDFSEIKKGKRVTKKRIEAFEVEFVEQLLTCHPTFKSQQKKGFFYLSYSAFTEGYWFLDAFEFFKKENIEVFGLKELKKLKYVTERPSVNLSVSSGVDWFDVEVNIQIEDELLTLKDLKKQWVKKSNYIKLGDGRLAVMPEEWIKKIEAYLRAGDVQKDGSLQVSKKRFNIIDELFDKEHLSTEVVKELSEKRRKIQAFQKIDKIEVPQMIQATLRGYQQEGYNWMCFLHQFGWGGVLADDMGLGKTLQVLTFINYLIDSKVKKPILVVLPTSLVLNWSNEIEKFCPELNYEAYYGPDRNPFESVYKSRDVILTSYGIMTNDIELLKKHQYSYIILDESQAIKNPNSLRYKAAMLLKAKNKLAMTGTPIENNTFDLYAQINFTNPGFLGSMQSFKTNYSVPIDKNGNEAVAQELQKMINPFLLRRTKELVATELPDKTEEVLYCEMGKQQRKVYEAYRNNIRNQVLNKIEEEGFNESKMIALQALTKLRQICNSPAILPDEDYPSDSVKADLLIEHIKEKTGQHKILIFSQFVSMLELISNRLAEEKVSFVKLSGSDSTKQRQAAVDDFQTNTDTRVFLISLKAGGTGLNLTAADYVYLVDPWWNPAVENQAIDRCYRIGQKNNVIAYRMICKDTVEEKILKYKSQKQQVADAIITTDDSVMKSLSQDDIMDLFS